MSIPFKSSVVLGQIFAQNDEFKLIWHGNSSIHCTSGGGDSADEIVFTTFHKSEGYETNRLSLGWFSSWQMRDSALTFSFYNNSNNNYNTTALFNDTQIKLGLDVYSKLVLTSNNLTYGVTRGPYLNLSYESTTSQIVQLYAHSSAALSMKKIDTGIVTLIGDFVHIGDQASYIGDDQANNFNGIDVATEGDLYLYGANSMHLYTEADVEIESDNTTIDVGNQLDLIAQDLVVTSRKLLLPNLRTSSGSSILTIDSDGLVGHGLYHHHITIGSDALDSISVNLHSYLISFDIISTTSSQISTIEQLVTYCKGAYIAQGFAYYGAREEYIHTVIGIHAIDSGGFTYYYIYDNYKDTITISWPDTKVISDQVSNII